MLESRLTRYAVGEGREECEWPGGITLVLREMKCHAPQKVKNRVNGLQPRGGSLRIVACTCRDESAQFAPEHAQTIFRQVLQAAHRRSLGHEARQFLVGRLLKSRPLFHGRLAQM